MTSLDSKLVIGDLDDAQFMRLCRDIDHWNEAEFGSAKLRAVMCEIETAGMFRAQNAIATPDECRAVARGCESAQAGMPAVVSQCQRGPDRCSLTVGDVETCLSDVAYDMNEVLCTAPMCDDLCGFINAGAANPASCVSVERACPALRFTRPSFDSVVALDPCPGPPPSRECVWTF